MKRTVIVALISGVIALSTALPLPVFAADSSATTAPAPVVAPDSIQCPLHDENQVGGNGATSGRRAASPAATLAPVRAQAG